MRELIVLYEHYTSEQLSCAFDGSAVSRIAAIYSYAANKTRLTDTRARARARVKFCVMKMKSDDS